MLVTRRLEFDSGHRLVNHESKCAHLHGHRYVAEISCRAQKSLDDIGRVIDFSVIKGIVGGWINTHWDHNFLLNPADPLRNVDPAIWKGKEPYIMPPARANPTAENMAAVLLEVSTHLLRHYPIHVTKIKLYETPNCFAEVFAQ